jgi:thioredoxin reductase
VRDDCDVVVGGGGIAGLAAAWARRDRDVLLCFLSGGRVETYPFRLPLSPADRLALIRVGVSTD